MFAFSRALCWKETLFVPAFASRSFLMLLLVYPLTVLSRYTRDVGFSDIYTELKKQHVLCSKMGLTSLHDSYGS